MDTTINRFKEEVINKITEQKPKIVKKVINADNINYICDLEEEHILPVVCGVNGIAEKLFYDFKVGNYQDNSRNLLRICFTTGDIGYTTPIIEVGERIGRIREVSSEMFHHDYSFDNYTSYKTEIMVTEELIKEYGFDVLVNMTVEHIVAFINEVEKNYNESVMCRYKEIQQEYEEKRARVKDLISNLINKDKAEEKQITQQDIIDKINSSNLTQLQIGNILEIIK